MVKNGVVRLLDAFSSLLHNEFRVPRTELHGIDGMTKNVHVTNDAYTNTYVTVMLADIAFRSQCHVCI